MLTMKNLSQQISIQIFIEDIWTNYNILSNLIINNSSVDPDRTQQQLPAFSCTSYIYLLPVASNQNAQYKQLFCYTLPCYKKFSPKHLYLWSAHKEKWCWMGQKFASRRNKKKGTQRCIQWRNCKKQSWHLWIALWQHLHFQQW